MIAFTLKLPGSVFQLVGGLGVPLAAEGKVEDLLTPTKDLATLGRIIGKEMWTHFLELPCVTFGFLLPQHLRGYLFHCHWTSGTGGLGTPDLLKSLTVVLGPKPAI